MKSRVHPKFKTKYRVGNWPAYERALVGRGDVTFWVTPEALGVSATLACKSAAGACKAAAKAFKITAKAFKQAPQAFKTLKAWGAS